MIVSFSMTEQELLAGKKTVTRRDWKPRVIEQWRKGSVHHAWSALPFVTKRNPRKLAVIRATRDAYPQRLGDMTAADLDAEGGMCATVEAFCELVGKTPDAVMAVCEFEIVHFVDGGELGGAA